MKPGTAKVKGRQTEQMLCDYLRDQWDCLYVERRRLNGVADRGDIAGIPGVTIEVKSGGRLNIAGWIVELRQEMFHDHTDHGFIAVRPKGQPNPAGWWTVKPLTLELALLNEAGYLPTKGTG